MAGEGGCKREMGRRKKLKRDCSVIYIYTHSAGTTLVCLSGFQHNPGLSKICFFDGAWELRVLFKLHKSEPRQRNQTPLSLWRKLGSDLTPDLLILSLQRDVNATFAVLQVLTRMACYLCCCSHDLRPERPHSTEHRQKPEDNEHSRGLNSSQPFILNKQRS